MATLTQNGIRLAITGCGHGVLNSIYASVKKAARLKGWDSVDLVIIGGDFEAFRNAYDLNAASIPAKYREMHDFHEYYSGKRTAPYLTIFMGGNHEASNYMFELHYGGWVAPKIYYLGASGVVRIGSLRIAGLSGIWKGYDYNKPHHERLPFSEDDVKTSFHQRELDTRKLLQIRTQIDIGLSHDWPRNIENYGNKRQLFQFKPHFEPDSENGTLGSVAANKIMEHLRPRYWFASHMHCKFAALRLWTANEIANGSKTVVSDIERPTEPVAVQNEDEIDLDMDDEEEKVDDTSHSASNSRTNSKKGVQGGGGGNEVTTTSSTVSQDLYNQLPESFRKVSTTESHDLPPPHPPLITNTATSFLALDKLEPSKRFLQLQEVTPLDASPADRPLRLQYDPEWLAITRAFALEGSPLTHPVPSNKGAAYYHSQIDEARVWIEQNALSKDATLTIPENFARVAPVFDRTMGIAVREQPREWPNPQTQAFCDLIGVENHFAIAEDVIERRMVDAPVLGQGGSSSRGGGWRGKRDFQPRGGFRDRGGPASSGYRGGRSRGGERRGA